jgi:glucosamine--fructose-6-phosphate aminotransferase (isomerizing)
MDYFLEEILSQPRVLRATLERYLEGDSGLRSVKRAGKRPDYDLVLLTGMGSSYFALYPACIYLSEHGVPAFMVEASELLHYYSGLVSEHALVVIASQSGETAEVKKLVAEVGGRTLIVSVTNGDDNYLARNSEVPLFLYAGEERAPASKTHTATIVVALLVAMHLVPTLDKERVQGLYASVDALQAFLVGWQERIDALASFLGQVDCVSLLGRGPSLAPAMAGALILKEASKIRAEGMSGGQFRHGPLEVVTSDFSAIVFAMRGRTTDISLRLARDIAEFGGKAAVIGSDEAAQGQRIFNLTLPPLDEFCAPLLEIVPVQLLSWKVASEKELQPGKFDKAKKVTLYE